MLVNHLIKTCKNIQQTFNFSKTALSISSNLNYANLLNNFSKPIDFQVKFGFLFIFQEHILDLTDEIELRKIREDEIIRSHHMDKKHIIDEMEDLKVAII